MSSCSSDASGLHRDDAACRRILRAADHYGVIGVPRQADEAEVKSAFRKLAREVHPDKNASPLASEAFKRLQKAYEVLSDPSSRRRYDACGDDEPRNSPPRYRYYHNRGPPPEMKTLASAMLPILVPMLFMIMMVVWQEIQYGPGSSWQKQQPRKPKDKEPREVIMKLTRSNADKACGVPGKDLCVVLLTDGTQGQREKQLLERLHSETSTSVRNSRGQSLHLKWALTVVRGRWASLLPNGATLPWVVVLKPSRTGIRAAALPVPKGGGKKKRRLSEGVPQLLQDIASGSAKFEQLKGNVSRLF